MANLSKIFSFVAIAAVAACAQNTTHVVRGTLTMGHEVMAFTPDGETDEYWVTDKSGELYEQYQHVAPIEKGPYTPVRAELKVVKLPKMQDGFGAEYDGTYDVVEIISLTPIKK